MTFVYTSAFRGATIHIIYTLHVMSFSIRKEC